MKKPRSRPVTVAAVSHARPQVTDFCSNSTHASWPVCDPALPPSKRAADIISRLSLPDKIKALGTDTPALQSAGLRPYNWWSEACHGISRVQYEPSPLT